MRSKGNGLQTGHACISIFENIGWKYLSTGTHDDKPQRRNWEMPKAFKTVAALTPHLNGSRVSTYYARESSKLLEIFVRQSLAPWPNLYRRQARRWVYAFWWTLRQQSNTIWKYATQWGDSIQRKWKRRPNFALRKSKWRGKSGWCTKRWPPNCFTRNFRLCWSFVWTNWACWTYLATLSDLLQWGLPVWWDLKHAPT